jgi:hypothetical protein
MSMQVTVDVAGEIQAPPDRCLLLDGPKLCTYLQYKFALNPETMKWKTWHAVGHSACLSAAVLDVQEEPDDFESDKRALSDAAVRMKYSRTLFLSHVHILAVHRM